MCSSDLAFVVAGRWTPAGYDERVHRPCCAAVLITPPSLVHVLRAGWQGAVLLLHPTAE